MMPSTHLRFGIETEFLLTPRQAREFKNIRALSDSSTSLNIIKMANRPGGLKMHIDFWGTYEGENDHME